MTGAVIGLGPLGVFLLMIPESACIPVPSELTLLAAGFGVDRGWFSFPAAVAAATAGNLVGSLIAYSLGRSGVLARLHGRAGMAVLRCERLFQQRGSSTVFIARILPLARTFVSLPAGHARVPLPRFISLTVAGCAIWSTAFILVGALAGADWDHVATTEGRASAAALAAVGVGFAIARRRAAKRD